MIGDHYDFKRICLDKINTTLCAGSKNQITLWEKLEIIEQSTPACLKHAFTTILKFGQISIEFLIESILS